MLIYESASCLNGRRSVMKGKYWASVSLHYAPTDKAVWNYTIDVRRCVHCFTNHFRSVWESRG